MANKVYTGTKKILKAFQCSKDLYFRLQKQAISKISSKLVIRGALSSLATA